jgi:hypothetical protein
MKKADEYRKKLEMLESWDAYLLAESGLPGPRGNLELAGVVAEAGDRRLFERYSALSAHLAPVNSPFEFLTFCGVLGLGRLLAEGNVSLLASLRIHASDPRWRLREAVAMALQQLGDRDMEQLLAAMQSWSEGTPLEQRAAAAALCEPRLLGEARHTRAVLQILDKITASLQSPMPFPREHLLILRKGLGYCWSVAVAALPGEGKAFMEKWLVIPNKDIQWIMQENLRKSRLARMDAAWVRHWQIRR